MKIDCDSRQMQAPALFSLTPSINTLGAPFLSGFSGNFTHLNVLTPQPLTFDIVLAGLWLYECGHTQRYLGTCGARDGSQGLTHARLEIHPQSCLG